MSARRRSSNVIPPQRRPSRTDYEHELQRLHFEIDKSQLRAKVFGYIAAVLFIYSFLLSSPARPLIDPKRTTLLPFADPSSPAYDGLLIPPKDRNAYVTLEPPFQDITAAHLGWIFADPFDALNFDRARYVPFIRKNNSEDLELYVENYLKKPWSPEGELCAENTGIFHQSVCAVALERYDTAHEGVLAVKDLKYKDQVDETRLWHIFRTRNPKEAKRRGEVI
ncbi:hypothetical protein BDV96DRAFT_648700 [Lophiotrema nucula]|uniref:Uncharacterized protein n=1 Tax=Lophiotrema nucula TaxID=690887 RepID=A0A6A5Z125_9PLEO|nr:hypothetical protein BDV96DRAFT_648700 [Lophiotrema nucula]